MEEAEGVRGRREKRKKMKRKESLSPQAGRQREGGGAGVPAALPARPPGAQRPLPSRPSPPAPAANTTPTRAPQRAAAARWHI